MVPVRPANMTYSESRLLWKWFRRIAAVATTGLLLCLMALPAFAHDDDAPPPPDPAAQAAAAQWIIGAVSLLSGFGVYYFMQRHRVMNSQNHTPDWDKKMGVGGFAAAIASAAILWVVLSSFSHPVPTPKSAGPNPGAATTPRTPNTSQ